VDLLYHEATYMDEMADKAAARYHSTTKQAAQCALEAGAKKLVVAHYSSRITDFDAYLRECTEVFPETVAATDCQVFEI
jgi:ribonuclease Z